MLGFKAQQSKLVTDLSFVYFVLLLWFVFVHLHKMLVLWHLFCTKNNFFSSSHAFNNWKYLCIFHTLPVSWLSTRMHYFVSRLCVQLGTLLL